MNTAPSSSGSPDADDRAPVNPATSPDTEPDTDAPPVEPSPDASEVEQDETDAPTRRDPDTAGGTT